MLRQIIKISGINENIRQIYNKLNLSVKNKSLFWGMTNSSKQFTSITSFVSQTASLKDTRFPQKQLNIYCLQNECSSQKIINIFHSYYEKFKWSYDNFNELILILSIAVKKIDPKMVSQNPKVKEETQIVLKKALFFLQDLITSKMLLVCLASKNKQLSITQNFIFAKEFINLLVPHLLALELYNEILDLLQNCNNSSKSRKLVTLNFLIEYMFVQTIIDSLNQQSEDNFRFTVLDILQDKKQFIFHLLWSLQNNKQNQLEFKQIVYLRVDVESPKNYGLTFTNESALIPTQNFNFLIEDWIIEAYKKCPNGSVWKSINLKNILDIYQFLFKLEVFASSPQIQDLDSLIPNNDEFLQIFSKFLMGQDFIEVNKKKNGKMKDEKENQHAIIKQLSDLRKMFNKVEKPYQNIFRKEVNKFFDQNSESSDKEKQK